MFRVLVADKNSTLRIGLSSVLRKNVRKVIIDEATNRDALLAAISHSYDLVVIDPLLNASACEDLIKDVCHGAPCCNVLVYTTLDERVFGMRALKSGAKGYLMKDSPVEELLAAVERVGQGKIHISAVLAEEIALSIAHKGIEQPHHLLSGRETQTFAMLVSGLTIGDISAALNLSSKTVSTNKTRIFTKLHVRTLSELIQYAVAQNLIDECRSKCFSLSAAVKAHVQ